ncbi:hypothetical protein I316_00788 [Kwoniella heveanensis BCC8398]|uniref:Peptidase A1 domain-containing protein n=1 Tax=Kwoniella heveanensis BCC8398 TaxID=1296120 RepID=A0A1B9H308_9TREE|nr:hypothetical protein I316_00788 [Kwoniella heveanensis BCC8398]
MSSPNRCAWCLVLLLALSSLLPAQADHNTDVARLGTEFSSMPLYRSGAGTNVLRVSVGTPGVEMDLTCSTNVDYMVVAATGCEECMHDAELLSVTDSSSLTISQQDLAYTFPYPAGSSSTLSIAGRFASDLIADERGDDSTARPVVLAAAVQTDDPEARLSGSDIRLTDGTAGFWGMGIDQERKAESMLHSMITTNSDGPIEQPTSFTVGFEINNYSTSTADQAGTVHWGAVPAESYEGEFNWLRTDRAVGGSWGFDLDRMRIGGEVIDLEANYSTIDPAFDAIYVPNSIADSFFAHVDGATRDPRDTTRWNLPCDTHIDLKITIAGVQYAVASSQIVQPRDTAGRTCWSSLVAWQRGSVPDERGEVRLGTPFMAGVYSAFYYSDSEQFVGLAGKPNSVNAHNLFSRAEGRPNMQLAGILIGTLLGVLLILFIICYARNRSSFQSIWYRAIRRQQRAQMDAVIRGVTLPPPMMAMAMPIPSMAVGGMPPPVMGGSMMLMPMAGPVVPLASVGARMMPPPMAGYPPVPPPYQQPISREMPMPNPAPQGYQQPQAEQHQPLLSPTAGGGNGQHPYSLQRNQMPATVQPQAQGYYSSRLQPTSPPRSRSGFMPFPILGKSRSSDKAAQDYGNGGYGQGQGQYGPEPPVSGGSKVRFGHTAARQMKSASSAASVNEFGAMVHPGAQAHGYGGPSGRHARQEQFMREYANNNAAHQAQAQHEGSPPGYHQHLPPTGGDTHRDNVNNTYADAPEFAHAAQGYSGGYGRGGGGLPPLAEVPDGTYLSPAHASGSPGREKKRYFAWRSGSPKAGTGGGYEAVSNPGQGRRGKSWFLGGGGGGADSWKDVEKRHEVEQQHAERQRRGLGWS